MLAPRRTLPDPPFQELLFPAGEALRVLVRWAADALGLDAGVDGLGEAVGKRTTRIATVRNIVLSHHWEQPPADFTLVLDLDGPNADLPVKRIAELVKGAGPEDWLGIFPCQNKAYYDLFALRHPMWCPWDLRKRYRLVRMGTLGLVPASVVKRSLIYDRQYRIPDTAPPIPVHSAFGGLGLYRTDAIRGCWYNGTSRTGSSICEHVAFNHMISRGRPGLFIDPALRNLAPEEHLGPGSGQPFPNEYSQP